MTPKISVIMPMYNVEPYVETAIRSVLEQTFRDFELILIDDCSTDRTLEIAKSFDDPRIKIIRLEKNLGGEKGAGAVRNVGLERAEGEYIYFMDSDDAILPKGLELLITAVRKTNADVAVGMMDFIAENPAFRSLSDVKLIPNDEKSNEPIESDLKKRILSGYCRNKLPTGACIYLYRHQFLIDNDIKYGDAFIHEDGVFMLEVHCATNKTVKVEEPFYIVRKHAGSLTRPSEPNFEDFARRIRSFLIVLDSFEEILSKALLREYGEIDYFFIDEVCLNIKNRAIMSSLGKYYQADIKRCGEIVREEVERRYSHEAPLIRKLLSGYIMSELSFYEARNECFRMKNTMIALKKTVNKVITI